MSPHLRALSEGYLMSTKITRFCALGESRYNNKINISRFHMDKWFNYLTVTPYRSGNVQQNKKLLLMYVQIHALFSNYDNK